MKIKITYRAEDGPAPRMCGRSCGGSCQEPKNMKAALRMVFTAYILGISNRERSTDKLP